MNGIETPNKRKERENAEREMKVHELWDRNKREKQNNKKTVGRT
jgi:hypothetical protein